MHQLHTTLYDLTALRGREEIEENQRSSIEYTEDIEPKRDDCNVHGWPNLDLAADYRS